jgi:hypothetical protein
MAITTINVPGGQFRTAEGCWDPEDHLVLYANDADSPPFISFISTDNFQVIKQIKFDGAAGNGPNATNGIEQCEWNPREHAFYLNLPEVNGNVADGNVVVINPHSLQIVQTFDIPVAQCAEPQGMAIGPAPQIPLGLQCKGAAGHQHRRERARHGAAKRGNHQRGERSSHPGSCQPRRQRRSLVQYWRWTLCLGLAYDHRLPRHRRFQVQRTALGVCRTGSQ